jgi:hypothetical protein
MRKGWNALLSLGDDRIPVSRPRYFAKAVSLRRRWQATRKKRDAAPGVTPNPQRQEKVCAVCGFSLWIIWITPPHELKQVSRSPLIFTGPEVCWSLSAADEYRQTNV